MKLIDKLNKIDINDLKNIDYTKGLEKITKNPENAVSIGVILITLLVSWSMYNNYQKNFTRLKNEIQSLETKQKTIDRLLQAKEDNHIFWDNIPQALAEGEDLNFVTNTAAKRNILIKSLIPIKPPSTSFYDTSGLNLSISARNFEDIWLFCYDLEKSPYGFRIDNWDLTLASESDRRQNIAAASEDFYPLTVQFSMAVINFKKPGGQTDAKK